MKFLFLILSVFISCKTRQVTTHTPHLSPKDEAFTIVGEYDLDALGSFVLISYSIAQDQSFTPYSESKPLFFFQQSKIEKAFDPKKNPIQLEGFVAFYIDRTGAFKTSDTSISLEEIQGCHHYLILGDSPFLYLTKNEKSASLLSYPASGNLCIDGHECI